LSNRVIKENRMGSTDGSSTDYGSSDFDSDTGSRVSSMSATSANEEHFMIDHDPLQAGDTEVDLSAFHDVCRKILAKPLPPNASTGILCRFKASSAADRRQLEKERKKKKRSVNKQKKDWENLSRTKPSHHTSADKQLESIAKRGVVDFFNAIEKHQSELKRKMEAAGSTEFRRSKVVKAAKETDITDKIEEEQAKKGPKKAWAALSKDDTAMLVGKDEPMEND